MLKLASSSELKMLGIKSEIVKEEEKLQQSFRDILGNAEEVEMLVKKDNFSNIRRNLDAILSHVKAAENTEETIRTLESRLEEEEEIHRRIVLLLKSLEEANKAIQGRGFVNMAQQVEIKETPVRPFLLLLGCQLFSDYLGRSLGKGSI